MPNEALIFEYKSGYAFAVPIERNWQVITQAVLVYLHYGVKRVIVAMIHPNHPDTLSESIMFSEEDLKIYSEKMICWTEMMNDEAPRTPNPISCAYCPARSVCPEYQMAIKTIVTGKDGMIVARNQMEAITPKERGELLDTYDIVEDIIKIGKECCKSLLKEDEKSVQGWRLQTSKSREITDDKKALDLMDQSFGEGSGMKCMEFNLGKAEEVAGEIKGSKKDGKEAITVALAPVIKFKPRNPSLTREKALK